jgi:hypothetical protein
VTPLTDAQLRAYFAFLYGPDEPSPAIAGASDDALEPFPLPFEDWDYPPEPDYHHPQGYHGDLCPDCGGQGDQGNEEDGASWACVRCHGCGYYPPCEVHAPTAPAEPWADLINSPITLESD